MRELNKMDENDQEEEAKKLSLIIRKPQEGKTFICIKGIVTDNSKNIHIVLTMNVISSSDQFCERLVAAIGHKRIIVFNTQKGAGELCHHAKTIEAVLRIIRDPKNNIKVVVCCAHVKRVRDSIPSLLDAFGDSKLFLHQRRMIAIHIDEAHKYIPESREFVRGFNASNIVCDIIGYSATPDNIWIPNDTLFSDIFVRDIEKDLSIIRSKEYYGIIQCKFHIRDKLLSVQENKECVDDLSACIERHTISDIVFNMSYNIQNTNNKKLYGYKFPFDIGNEILHLKFIQEIIDTIDIPQDSYTYNFVPAFTRKVTHYQTTEILLKKFPNANVVVMNGNGIELYRNRSERERVTHMVSSRDYLEKSSKGKGEEIGKLREPSYVIQKLIEHTRNYPTFVTGLTCVGMSVTLINETIRNFDNVIMSHHHLSADKLYQLCRFVFNYSSWSEKGKKNIKTTQFYSLTQYVVDTCLGYEKHIDELLEDYKGSSVNYTVINKEEPTKLTDTQLKCAALKLIERKDASLWKKFKVYDGNDIQSWALASDFYKDVTGNDLGGKSLPEKAEKGTNKEGFYLSSTTKLVDVQENNNIKKLDKQNWWSMLQLVKGQLNYARLCVGYDASITDEDKGEYTIWIKYVRLKDNEYTRAQLDINGK